MQFKLLSLALIAVSAAHAAAVEKRAAVCPAGHSALCCQLDVDGVIDTSCTSAGVPKSIKAFEATCAKSGRTAECCLVASGTDGISCVEA